MNLKDIKEIIKLIDSSSLTEFKLEMEDTKLSIKKETEVKFIDQRDISTTVAVDRIEKVVKEESDCKDTLDKNDDSLHIVKSPIVGVFYASPNPELPSYVKPGDRVKCGDVLCIIEAMKLMNEINADVDGEIVEILVENQSPVEYGQPLFSIRKV